MKKEELSFIDEIEGNALPYISKEFVPIISHEYDDILHLKRPEPGPNHPRMSMEKRAAQFSPFEALGSGHKQAVRESERLTDEFIELDEYEKMILNDKLQELLAYKGAEPEVCITYFVPDDKKAGGSYEQSRGTIKKVDEYTRVLVMNNGTRIPFEMITNITGDILDDYQLL